MKSNFLAAMKAKNMPWANLTRNASAIDMSPEVFQYKLLKVLTNMALFSIDPNSVSMICTKTSFVLLWNVHRLRTLMTKSLKICWRVKERT